MPGSASDSAALLRVATPTTPAPEPLFDREPELAAIAAACSRARDGEGSVLGI
jgi:hypothetical protein